MTAATPSQVGLARLLLHSPIGPGGGSLAAPEAAEHVFQLLSLRLAVLFTLVGSDALLMRAVHIAGIEFPFLQRVATAPTTDQLAVRLRDSAYGEAPSQVAEGFLAVLATLIALLVSFIGEDLTWGLLRDVWPELPVTQLTAESRNGHEEANP